MLAKHGYGVLLYDQRACGESQGKMRSYGWLDADDLLEAVKFVQLQPDVDPERIGVLGTSLGGQIAIRATAQSPAIRAVVSDGTGMAVAADIPPAQTPKEWFYGLSNSLLDLIQWAQTGVKPPRGVIETIPEIAPRPLLLIATGQSERFPGMELRYGRALYAASGEPKTLWELPEVAHCGGLAAHPQEYEQKVVAFFEAALLK
jgi:pimeloyl-ACP methyl ester carboxylesterase